LTEIAGSLQQLLDVQVARARVEAREKAFRALGWLLVSALLLALTVIAGLYVLRGLSGLLTGVLWNVPWAGDLAAGAAGLLLALAIGLLLRARSRRRNLRRMREKFRESPASQPEAE
jgi:pilus assembly protein TadC